MFNGPSPSIYQLSQKQKNIVISEQGVRPDPGKVRMYQPDGSPMKILQPGQPFKQPTDMAALNDGRFAVRDANGIQLFDSQGTTLTQGCIFFKQASKTFEPESPSEGFVSFKD